MQELTKYRQWVLWRNVRRGDKSTKVPYTATGHEASSTDPSTWTDYQTARDAYRSDKKRYAGIGFVLTPADPFAGVDLDDCRNPDTGQIADWAQQIIDDCGSYAEVSPSQTGVKIFVKGEVGKGRKSPYQSGAVELYDRARYFTVTGQAITDHPITENTPALTYVKNIVQTSKILDEDRIIERLKGRLEKMPDAVSGDAGHDKTFRAACEIWRHGLSDEKALEVLEWYNAAKCEPPWDEDQLAHKLTSARQEVLAVGEFGKRVKCKETAETKERRPFVWAYGADIEAYEESYRFLIDGILVADENCIVAGASKTLKTSTSIDLAVSLASGKPFLGQFAVPEAVNVAVLSGETAKAGLYERVKEVCGSRDLPLRELGRRFAITTTLPRFDSADSLSDLQDALESVAPEVVIIDPAYLCMDGQGAANYILQGRQLSAVADVVRAVGATVVLNSHTKDLATGRIPTIRDIKFSGFAEWCGQWLLWARQTEYQPGTGHHEMVMNVGGRAGFSGLYSVTINEGNRHDDIIGGQWAVEVTGWGERESG